MTEPNRPPPWSPPWFVVASIAIDIVLILAGVAADVIMVVAVVQIVM